MRSRESSRSDVIADEEGDDSRTGHLYAVKTKIVPPERLPNSRLVSLAVAIAIRSGSVRFLEMRQRSCRQCGLNDRSGVSYID